MSEELYTGGIARIHFAFVRESGDPVDLTLCSRIIVTMTRPVGTVKYTRDGSLTEIIYETDGKDGLAYIDTREGEMARPGNYEWQGWTWDASGGPYPSAIVVREVKRSNPIPA